MPLGILEPVNVSHVPGTVLLKDTEHRDYQQQATILKKGQGRHSHIILQPQPSENPNDPLSWPLWQRDLLLLLWCACSITTIGGFGPILAAVAPLLIQEFHIEYTEFAHLGGYNLLATGCIGIFICASMRKYGRRAPLIYSIILAVVGSLWAALAKSYGSLLGARIIQGFTLACFEFAPFIIVSDLYFVHQRGSRTAIFVASFSAISNIPSMVAGKAAENLGWRWIFWMLLIVSGVLLILCVCFGWETAYSREKSPVDQTTEGDPVGKGEESFHFENEMRPTQRQRPQDSGRMPIRKRLALYHEMYCNDSMIKMLILPALICCNPAVLWAISTMTFPVLWVVGISLIQAQIFSAPPYLFTPAEIGYLSAGPVVGGVLGCIAAGWLSDFSAKKLAQYNHGIYEPEFRLVVILGLTILSPMGYFLFGNLTEEGKPAVASSVLYGVVVCGAQFGAVSVGTYLVDAYPQIKLEASTAAMVVKNFMFFGFSYFINDWLARWGPAKMFNCIGGIQMALCLMTIPMWIYGKRVRAWWSRLTWVQKS